MRMISEIDAMQLQAGRWLRSGVRIGLVPTMGFLHAGHLRLIERARQAVGRRGVVVVSLYVNPTQFGPKEDFSCYPRDLSRDRALCRNAGVDVLFIPNDAAMYPGGGASEFSTHVVEEQLSQVMEGRSRPAHFRGVTTVVAKLFNIVRPEVAVFGAKDWQQAMVLRRMVSDLNIPVRMLVAPTVRERDGLALSSRNQYLSAEQRSQATVLWRALQHARKRVRSAAVSAARLRSEVQGLVKQHPEARLDYVEFFAADTLVPVRTVRRGTHMALAVFVGRTRLIDNGRL
jgi:pantoate--beta-alanine ligase